MRRLVGTLGLIALTAAAAGAQDSTRRPVPPLSGTAFTKQDALDSLKLAIDTPAPTHLSYAERTAYNQETDWLRTVYDRINALPDAPSANPMRPGKKSTPAPKPSSASNDTTAAPTPPRRKKSGLLSPTLPDVSSLMATIELEARRYNSTAPVLRGRRVRALTAVRLLQKP